MSSLRQLIRTEMVRAGVQLPVLTDIGQDSPATPATLQRKTTSAWLADYEASSNTLPAGDTPAWTEYSAGAGATQAVTGSVLTITTAATTDSLFNYVALAGLDASKGSYLEAEVQVASDSADVNGGGCLALFDGQFLSVLWLRTDGLNLDACANVPVTLSDAAHNIALHVQGEQVRVYLDGELQQTGAPIASTTLEAAAFGSWIDPTP